MNSLFREGVVLSKIDTLFISHFHGDHFFGFPFLALRLFADRVEHLIRVIAPCVAGIRLREICILAFGDIHPVHRWVDEHISFIEIEKGKEIDLGGGVSISPIPMSHFIVSSLVI